MLLCQNALAAHLSTPRTDLSALARTQVGREGHVAGADVVIQDIHELPRVLPSIFAAEPPRVEAAAEVGVPIRVPA